MNDPEVTRSNAVPETKLVAHEKAVEAAGIAIALVMRVPAPLKSIADQVIRSGACSDLAVAEPQNVKCKHPPRSSERCRWRLTLPLPSVAVADYCLRPRSLCEPSVSGWREKENPKSNQLTSSNPG